MRRRALLCALPLLGLPAAHALAPRRLQFPRDHGAHPDLRTEWWYITGTATGEGREFGFQLTFFRSRVDATQDMTSKFAARQLVFAHAAVTDVQGRRLLHDQRIARQGFGLAEAALNDTSIVLDDWSMRRQPDGRFTTRAGGGEFQLELSLQPTQPVLLQGDAGYSRKGPLPAQASHYYSLPHLRVSGTLVREGRRQAVTGQAWMDREWSSTLLDPKAVGWDWVGINLDGGGALMAFQVRDAQGRALWTGGSLREPGGRMIHFGPQDVRFTTVRRWRSPRTGATYPVERELIVRLPTGERRWRVRPLFDDQELDSRAGGGPVYWEGAVTVEGGRGYLELTGYGSALRL